MGVGTCHHNAGTILTKHVEPCIRNQLLRWIHDEDMEIDNIFSEYSPDDALQFFAKRRRESRFPNFWDFQRSISMLSMDKVLTENLAQALSKPQSSLDDKNFH